jgi:hypothetical protein
MRCRPLKRSYASLWPQTSKLRAACAFPYMLLEGTDIDRGPRPPKRGTRHMPRGDRSRHRTATKRSSTRLGPLDPSSRHPLPTSRGRFGPSRICAAPKGRAGTRHREALLSAVPESRRPWPAHFLRISEAWPVFSPQIAMNGSPARDRPRARPRARGNSQPPIRRRRAVAIGLRTPDSSRRACHGVAIMRGKFYAPKRPFAQRERSWGRGAGAHRQRDDRERPSQDEFDSHLGSSVDHKRSAPTVDWLAQRQVPSIRRRTAKASRFGEDNAPPRS